MKHALPLLLILVLLFGFTNQGLADASNPLTLHTNGLWTISDNTDNNAFASISPAYLANFLQSNNTPRYGISIITASNPTLLLGFKDKNDWYLSYSAIITKPPVAGNSLTIDRQVLFGLSPAPAPLVASQYGSFKLSVFDYQKGDLANYFYTLSSATSRTDYDIWADNNGTPLLIASMHDVAAVPIPGAIWLLGSGLVGLVGLRRKFFS